MQSGRLKDTGFPFGVMEMIEVVVAQHSECAKCHWIALFKMVKMVNFMLCFLTTNKQQQQNDTFRCGKCFEGNQATCCKRERLGWGP